MSERPPEPQPGDGEGSLRSLAERLGGAERAAALDEVSRTFARDVRPVDRVAARSGPTPISIWQPRERDGELIFERPLPQALGDHYAQARSIQGRKRAGCRRICWFGESAAAGYLYAPHLTPASVLQSQLDALAGEQGAYEVIDLARTNERLGTLVRTVEEATQLEPDLLAIFTGNNLTLLETPELSPHFPSVDGRRALGRALRAEGLVGVAKLGARRVLQAAAAALSAIATVAERQGIPVVIVVPEVNLRDWETNQPPPWLTDDGNARWCELEEQARRSLKARRWDDLERLAESMLQLDPLVGPAVHRLLAHAHLGRGRRADAIMECREEVAACHYPLLGCLAAPQISPMLQELLRRGGRHHGFDLVDLPSVFAEALDGELPGSDFFLDYCHLTRQGIEITCAAVAATIRRRLDGDTLEWQQVIDRSPPTDLSPQQEAATRLGAAIHTAHRMLPVSSKQPILRHWARETLAAGEGGHQLLLDISELRCCPTPAVITAAFARIQGSAYKMTLQHGLRWPHLDCELLEAILATLDPGDAGRQQIVALIARLSPSPGQVLELSRAPFLWEPVAQPLAVAMDEDRCGFLRSVWPASHFALPADGRSTLRLRTVLRLPAPRPDHPRPDHPRPDHSATVEIHLNGRSLGRIEASATWQRSEHLIEPECLQPGLNRLTLKWPPPDGDGGEALERAADRLERGLDADLHPIFGEVFALKLSLAQD